MPLSACARTISPSGLKTNAPPWLKLCDNFGGIITRSFEIHCFRIFERLESKKEDFEDVRRLKIENGVEGEKNVERTEELRFIFVWRVLDSSA